VFPSQIEADRLIHTEKHRESEESYDFPSLGGFLSVPITSGDRRETFLLDVNRRRIVLTQATYNLRYRELVMLVRLDLDDFMRYCNIISPPFVRRTLW